MMRKTGSVPMALIVACMLGVSPSVSAGASGTPINCDRHRTSIGHDAVLVSSGEALYRWTEAGWLQLSLPGSWDQVQVRDNSTIYLYADASNTLYRSADGGMSWALAATTPFCTSDSEELFVQTDSDMLFLSVVSGPACPSNQGIWRSIDNGLTWQHMFDSVHALTVLSPIAFSPTFSQDGTAFLAETGRGTFVGIRKSTDFGQNWDSANNGLQAPAQYGNPGWFAVSPRFSQDSTLFAGGGPLDWGFYKTANAGASWEFHGVLHPISAALSPDYLSDQTLLMADPAIGVYRSRDGGGSLEKISDGMLPLLVGIRHVDASDGIAGEAGVRTQTLEYWAIAPEDQSQVCHLYRSLDEGETWEPQQLFDTPYAYFFPVLWP